MLLVTKTELALAVASKSEKAPFEGEEDRVEAQGRPNEWLSEHSNSSLSLF